MLERLLRDTAAFAQNFYDVENMTLEERQKWTKEYVLCLTDETHEILREINWKHHRPATKEVVRPQLLIEGIDALKFWSCIMSVWQFTPMEIMRAYNEKTTIVEGKYEQTKTKAPTGPRIIVDIDDVLASFKESFYVWLNSIGIKASISHPSYYLPNDLFTNGKTNAELLEDFISLRGFRDLPRVWGSVEMLEELRAAFDLHITLLTARPKTPLVEHDTLFWLFGQSVRFHDLVFCEDKETYKGVVDAAFVIEDRWRHARAYAQKGAKVLLLSTPYNQGSPAEIGANPDWLGNIYRCVGWSSIGYAAQTLLNELERTQNAHAR